MEYFYLREDENVVSMIKKYAQERLLWKIKLDDFHTNYHSVLDLDQKESLERNVHIHNRLIGLEYTCLTNFEIMPIHVEEDISDIPVIDDVVINKDVKNEVVEIKPMKGIFDDED